MTVEKHWDSLAAAFESKVGNPIEDDRNRTIRSAIEACSDKSAIAIDFGCGMGHALPHLSSYFRKVIAIDISDQLLQRARQEHTEKQITFMQKDLSLPVKGLPKVHLCFCCNVAISADLQMNMAIIKNALSTVGKNGHVLFVLPSIESAHLSAIRLFQWYQEEHTGLNQIDKSEFAEFTSGMALPHIGILYRSGVPTRHYLKEEIELMFSKKNMQIKSLSKVEYNWDTEFDSPPEWMQSPYPWDWLVHCTKNI